MAKTESLESVDRERRGQCDDLSYCVEVVENRFNDVEDLDRETTLREG